MSFGLGFGRRLSWEDVSGGNQFWLETQTEDFGSFVSIPLWLLAFLCLAWPVTSFLLARRRRGRGFPMEVAVDGSKLEA